MAKQSVEDIKRESKHLRGTIAEEFASDSTHFSESNIQLLKFHGSYQQDDRDLRKDLKKEGKEPAYAMMVRSSIPGGHLTAEQWLVHDRCADEFGNGTLRLTSRQGIQLHGVLKGDLKSHIQRINESGITSWGACGDGVRNTMAPPSPLNTPAHHDAQALAQEIASTFRAKSRAYSEIWLDGEKITPDKEDEPLYGEVYLPRKFKLGIAVPPRNDVDVYTHDIGLVPHFPSGEVEGYTLIAGGGMGMTNNKPETYPVLGQPLGYAKRDDVITVCRAIIEAQRDHGNRENRKRARLKYLLEDRGLDWMREQVKSRCGVTLEPVKEYQFDTVGDMLGWNEQGDGKLMCGIFVQEGRIKDTQTTKWRSGIREICEKFGFAVRITPNTNLLLIDIDPSQRDAVNEVIRANGLPLAEEFSETWKTGHACVSLPTCGLGLAESERVFPSVLAKIDAIVRELGLEREQILIRMTGCPNGCSRPYNADFGFVGRSPDKYALYVGGSHRGDRLAGLYKSVVTTDEIPAVMRSLLEEYASGRSEGESFTDWWGRTHITGTRPAAQQFHEEM